MKSLLTTALFLLVAFQAHSTTLIYKSFDDLVNEAEGIVVGTVTNIQAIENEQGNIYTYVTFGNLQIIHGRYDKNELTLRIEGGRVGNHGIAVEGSPRFRLHEKLVLFIKGNGRDIVPLVGWEQGLFRVMRDPELRREIITDSRGNKVFAVKEGHIIKEQKVMPDAEIICNQRPLQIHSEPLDGGVIDTQKVEQMEMIESKKDTKEKRTLQLAQFVEEIESRAKQRKDTPRPLVSVEVGQTMEVVEGADDKPPAIREKIKIKQEPNIEPSPGELPQRIETETDTKSEEETEKKD